MSRRESNGAPECNPTEASDLFHPGRQNPMHDGPGDEKSRELSDGSLLLCKRLCIYNRRGIKPVRKANTQYKTNKKPRFQPTEQNRTINTDTRNYGVITAEAGINSIRVSKPK